MNSRSNLKQGKKDQNKTWLDTCEWQRIFLNWANDNRFAMCVLCAVCECDSCFHWDWNNYYHSNWRNMILGLYLHCRGYGTTRRIRRGGGSSSGSAHFRLVCRTTSWNKDMNNERIRRVIRVFCVCICDCFFQHTLWIPSHSSTSPSIEAFVHFIQYIRSIHPCWQNCPFGRHF